MCQAEEPRSVDEALVMLDRALGYLACTGTAALSRDQQARSLLALERAESRHTAARARMVAAFTSCGGYEDDGHGTARTWLRWRTRITRGAAAGAVGWARRLADHPAIAAALAAGDLSASWSREICRWTDRLPEAHREDADAILTEAARGGAELADLAALAQEMYERAHPGDPEPCPDGDPHGDRALWLGITLGGAGRLEGNLTPGCAAAVAAVMESLGRKAGPEDTRSAAQRRHDALEEACRRLIAAGLLPDRAGQPTQAQVHLTLSQLRDLPGAARHEKAWLAVRARQPGWLTGADADAAACDAAMAPIVTGHADPDALDRLVQLVLSGPGEEQKAGPRAADKQAADKQAAAEERACPDGGRCCSDGSGRHRASVPGRHRGGVPGRHCGGVPGRPGPEALSRLRQRLLALAADVMSGPGGLASWLRQAQLGGPLAAPSLPVDVPLPLDTAGASPTIPAPLRRAAIARHPICAFGGCDVPASACQIHHLVPRSQGGPTALRNLVPLCSFHHLVVIHRWRWALILNPDGSTTATSPGGVVIHSHGPPAQAA